MKKIGLLLFVLFITSQFTWGQESAIYSTGFEASEGFTASTVYNNTTVAFTGPTGQEWGTYYGTPSTTAPISGSQSMQMRWYTSAISNLGYTFTNFDLSNVTRVTFKAANLNAINVIVSYSTDGGNSFTGDSTFALTATSTDYEYKISATGEYSSIRLKFQLTFSSQPSATSRLYIDDVTVYGIQSVVPSLTVDPTSLTGFTYVEGSGPSTSQSYNLSGSNLTPADSLIAVAGSTNYEVSTDNITFSDTVKIDYTSGAFADTTIYVRLKAGLSVGTYNGESISNSGGGATEQVVTVNGSVTALTALTVNPSALSGFSYIVGNGPSSSKSYKLSGSNLTPADSSVKVAGSVNYKVSTDNLTFTDTLKIAYTGGTLADTTIYVRLMAGLSAGDYNGEFISNFGGGAATKNVTVSGSVGAFFPIDSLKINNANGISLKLNDTVNTSGIVTSILQLGTGTSGPGTIQNANTAISVYGSSFTGTPGLQIGDSVVVTNWKVTQYNGLTELSFTSTSGVQIISSGHKINPLVVTIPQIKGQAWDGFEKYEGMLLRINNVRFVQGGSTVDVGTSSGVNYQIFNGVDTLDFRIVKTNLSIIGKTLPTERCDVVGILQQFKTSIPYNSGYQLMPLDSSGIITRVITAIDSLKQNNANGITKALNDTINTTGIVTSIKQLGTGASGPGTLQNTNTAVAIYGNTFTTTPGLQLGDSIVVYNWKVTNYNGLTELSYIANSSVEIVSKGHVVSPLVVTIPEIKGQNWNGFEKLESMLLQINNVKFVQTGNFYDGVSSGVNYQIFNGTDTLDFRVVRNDSSLHNKPIPTGEVNIVGILQQYKTSMPYNAGYQILPLDSSGIQLVTGVDDMKGNIVRTYQLEQNYPNPFNPSTKIRFSIPQAGNVKLTVFNILGEKVQTLINEEMSAGTHSVDFMASNLSSGIYIYRIESGSFTQTKKMTLLK